MGKHGNPSCGKARELGETVDAGGGAMDAAAGKEVRLDGSTSRSRPSRAEEVYLRLKQDIASFRLVPGDRFTEGGICARLDVSRTPVRQALYRLQQEGYVEVLFRAGWRVLPIDFKKFEELYVLRRLLEVEAVRRLCLEPAAFLSERYDALAAIWLGPMEARETDSVRVGGLDEQFHGALVEAAGNAEIARVHRDVTEHIRIIRRLDFTWAARIESTYEEHGQILRAISAGRGEEACRLLSAHIVASQAEIRKITLNQIQMAKRQSLQSLGNAGDDDVGGAEDAPAGDVSGA